MINYTTNVRDWYATAYPTDELGRDIRDGITFDDVLTAIYQGKDIYRTLGAVDSIVRERVFAALSEYSGLPYSRIYDLWLAS